MSRHFRNNPLVTQTMALLVISLMLGSCLLMVKGLSPTGSLIADKYSIPYQADLIVEVPGADTRYRTGTLISCNYVLTAANCVDGSSKITVIMGVYNVEDKNEPTRRTYLGDAYTAHPWYNGSEGYHDIAVIHLNESAEINAYIKPVTLPHHPCTHLFGKQARVSGWGNVVANTPWEYSVLRYAYVTIGSHANCHPQFPQVTSAQMCPVPTEVFFHISDIGAPLVFKGVQIGIAAATSFTNGIESHPQVYTMVDRYLPWIKNNTDVKIGH
ncbi:hypothetical protein PPYR_13622 [Photinus pyralis]|uniref:Peptidase S1 domain-containing protein n=1 Tax=Photinus pyralis TaxID=7054 RepID=A0A5N4A9K2_PHOPY|nr:brachyurin-like [Photinus pyralis]KAB0794002.1 hypothetical protein PPYR_13622 [Photinus pyralis]